MDKGLRLVLDFQLSRAYQATAERVGLGWIEIGMTDNKPREAGRP
jgi:hypothetical protein